MLHSLYIPIQYQLPHVHMSWLPLFVLSLIIPISLPTLVLPRPGFCPFTRQCMLKYILEMNHQICLCMQIPDMNYGLCSPELRKKA